MDGKLRHESCANNMLSAKSANCRFANYPFLMDISDYRIFFFFCSGEGKAERGRFLLKIPGGGGVAAEGAGAEGSD